MKFALTESKRKNIYGITYLDKEDNKVYVSVPAYSEKQAVIILKKTQGYKNVYRILDIECIEDNSIDDGEQLSMNFKGITEDLLTESKNDGVKKEFNTITGVDLLGKGVSTHHLSYDPEIVIFIDASAFGSYNTMNSDFVHHAIHFMNRTKVPVSISDIKKVKFYFYNRETKEYEIDINFGRVLTLNNKYGLVLDDLKVQEA